MRTDILVIPRIRMYLVTIVTQGRCNILSRDWELEDELSERSWNDPTVRKNHLECDSAIAM